MKRPAAVIAAAVIAFVFAGLGLCGLGVSIPILLLDPSKQPENHAYRPFLEIPWFLTYTRVVLALSAVVSLSLIAVGVGLLRMRAWARKGMIAWAIFQIVTAVVGSVISIQVYIPALSRAEGVDPIQMKAAAIGAWVGVVISFFTGVIVPVVVLCLMLVRSTAEAFRAPAEGALPESAP